MGEIISKIGRTKFQDNPCEFVDIEINLGNIVHMQTNAWRIELSLNEFVSFSRSVVAAATKLRENKGLQE